MSTQINIGGQTYDQRALDLSNVTREFRSAWKMPESGTVVEYDPVELKKLMAVKVQAERVRRLAEGFDYDFGDARGTHRIGTTLADLEGWREVTDLSNALLASGDTVTQIDIVTDTGSCAVTAAEWQAVLLAAAAFRQPIWAGSFALQSMDPIPQDYATNETYWTA